MLHSEDGANAPRKMPEIALPDLIAAALCGTISSERAGALMHGLFAWDEYHAHEYHARSAAGSAADASASALVGTRKFDAALVACIEAGLVAEDALGSSAFVAGFCAAEFSANDRYDDEHRDAEDERPTGEQRGGAGDGDAEGGEQRGAGDESMTGEKRGAGDGDAEVAALQRDVDDIKEELAAVRGELCALLEGQLADVRSELRAIRIAKAARERLARIAEAYKSPGHVKLRALVEGMEAKLAALVEKERLKKRLAARLAGAGMSELSVQGVATVVGLIDAVFATRTGHGKIISSQVSGSTRRSRRRRVKKAAGKPPPETAERKKERLEARRAGAGMSGEPLGENAFALRFGDLIALRSRTNKIVVPWNHGASGTVRKKLGASRRKVPAKVWAEHEAARAVTRLVGVVDCE